MINFFKRIVSIIFNVVLVFTISCVDTVIEEPIENIIYDIDFNFHQDVNNLFFSIKTKVKDELIDNVSLIWYGTDRNNSPDNLILLDDGLNGDIILGDGVFSKKFSNDSTVINNILGDDSGRVYLDVIVNYDGLIETKTDSFKIGNIIPRIISITVPDTITRSAGTEISLHEVKAEVVDADGNSTIKWVGFTSSHQYLIQDSILTDSLMNNGNYIYLHDDGSEEILYDPDFTSGDSLRYDGIYTFRIPVFGSANTNPSLQTKTGTFIWKFIVQDETNEYSKLVTHNVVIQ